ncbi:DNA glycosylase [Mycena belliarum]|uniref:Adenine DNA glycosylase n=1 Tax=Mycena belliarum TaxID=1033014 RepID=A0AAD6UFG1_9AGAR|nr:DNA glycosylase [Mycena belliae]
MGKRRLSSSEAESEVNFSDSDDGSYASKEPKPRVKATTRCRTTNKRTKRDLGTVNDDSSATQPRPLAVSSHAKAIHAIRAEGVAPIRAALLKWYSTVHASRNMPWRKPFDLTLNREERAQRAYEVWISEIMLQQTQVATVIPYYNRWMEKYPTIRDLAGASIDQVNSLWKGLGYYSRASRLLVGAQKAVAEYAGRLPDNAKDMQSKIPGIGRYSAGAICSIAYGENVPVLDGNVNRLLSRFLALHAPPKAKTTLDILWNAAGAMVQNLASIEYPGDVNQALIELGSTVCKVRDPDCASCPLRPWCAAHATPMPVSDIEDLCTLCEPLVGEAGATAYPMRADKKKSREELDIVHVLEWRNGSDRQFLLVRRPEGGLLAGLDEFPTSPNVAASTSKARQLKIAQEIVPTFLHGSARLQDVAGDSDGSGASASLRIAKVQPVGDVLHVFSHIRKTYRVQWVLLEGGVVPPQLAIASVLEENENLKKGAGKGKVKNRKPEGSTVVPVSTWVPLDAVAARNIGTGVVKVWNLCKMLWEEE